MSLGDFVDFTIGYNTSKQKKIKKMRKVRNEDIDENHTKKDLKKSCTKCLKILKTNC